MSSAVERIEAFLPEDMNGESVFREGNKILEKEIH